MATCTTRSALLSALRPPATVRLVSFSALLTFALLARSAGASPNTIAVSVVTAATNATTRQSITVARPVLPGSSCLPQYPTRIPNAPPSEESSRLSVSSCRTSRARVAPSDRRTEISFCRPVARESSRLATFAHTMSSTSTTTIVRIVTARRSSVFAS